MIYFLQADGIGRIKIGFTDGDDPSDRLAAAQTGSCVPLRLLGTMPGSMEDEKNLHRRFAAFNTCGEWFDPVPELLSLISHRDREPCGLIGVAEKSVSINVLTVGRKQFTKGMLAQLPVEDAILWPEEWHHVSPDSGPKDSKWWLASVKASAVPLTAPDVWGWVSGGWEESHRSHYRWIIFRRDDRLYKDKDYDSPSLQDILGPLGGLDHRAEAFLWLYGQRHKLPGFRKRDQLFIGI